jgi:hypothetical protein
MQALILALSALALAALVAFVASPLLRGSESAHDPGAGHDALRLAALERRDRALAALKELEFDHRTGKVGDLDYHALLAGLRAEAADALRAIAAAAAPVAASSRGARLSHPRREPAVGARGSRR